MILSANAITRVLIYYCFMMTENLGISLFIDGMNSNLAVNYNKTAKQILIESLVEDVSNLLNTKPIYVINDGVLKNFIINYGLADLSCYSSYSKEDQKKAGEMIKECLSRFEPRLKDIDVVPIQKEDNYGVILYFRITAVINYINEMIPVVLESEVNNLSNKIYLRLGDQ